MTWLHQRINKGLVLFVKSDAGTGHVIDPLLQCARPSDDGANDSCWGST